MDSDVTDTNNVDRIRGLVALPSESFTEGMFAHDSGCSDGWPGAPWARISHHAWLGSPRDRTPIDPFQPARKHWAWWTTRTVQLYYVT